MELEAVSYRVKSLRHFSIREFLNALARVIVLDIAVADGVFKRVAVAAQYGSIGCSLVTAPRSSVYGLKLFKWNSANGRVRNSHAISRIGETSFNRLLITR